MMVNTTWVSLVNKTNNVRTNFVYSSLVDKRERRSLLPYMVACRELIWRNWRRSSSKNDKAKNEPTSTTPRDKSVSERLWLSGLCSPIHSFGEVFPRFLNWIITAANRAGVMHGIRCQRRCSAHFLTKLQCKRTWSCGQVHEMCNAIHC